LKSNAHTNDDGQVDAASLAGKLRGLLLPFPTPFDAGGELNLRALRSNIVRWNATGINGYVALGSTGERVHLDESEYAELIEAAREAVPEGLALVVGAGQSSTRISINEVRRAATCGAHAVLVITPNFYRTSMTQAALTDYYTAIADAAPVPVMLYSMPGLTGIAFAPETVARLSEHANIIGLKDSSNDLLNLALTLSLVRDDFIVLTGNGAVLYAALAAGAHGAILAAACVATNQCLAIMRAVKHGDYASARNMQRVLTPLAQAVTTRYGIGGLKAALELNGFAGGRVRAPLQDASDEARVEIGRLIEAVGIENAAVGIAGTETSGDQYRVAGATKE
jgi:4-hydroxy-2-oxoglutarate aldolase